MIPARGKFRVRTTTCDGTSYSYRVAAWDDEGRPLVVIDGRLQPAALLGAHEVVDPERRPVQHFYFDSRD